MFQFGLPIPNEIQNHFNSTPHRSYGARAIYTNQIIDILHDRQSIIPDDPNLWNHSMLLNYMNNTGFPFLKENPIDKNQMIYKISNQYAVAAKATGGYLYIGSWMFHLPNCQYELTTIPEINENCKWSGNNIPKIGDTVTANFNNLGTGTVIDYFIEYKFLGVRVLLNQRPDWHKKQVSEPWALLFGKELA